MLKFDVPGVPVGKGRPRAAKAGKHITLYTPEKTAAYESTVALTARQAMAGNQLIDGPVSAVLDIRLPVPQSWSKRKQAAALGGTELPTKKPDADNVIKVIFDAINGVVWHDDTQVVDIVVRKRYAAVPGVAVEIERFVPHMPLMRGGGGDQA
ncbi:RusA family crossover junction endodeoxyribonuclease [Bordetella bronchiseptica]|uniref:RusA family crossover junction endodeoxyribonuclease n=1 Tax=Bordetella bronchiseptica TaxID=518 RepID=UPI000461CADB|nr:RusA family crossover junction endodeoxyribonuclease [Bordetella bronchiseptica]KDC15366.1 crossover junction endodeoxyribonuclease RusA [Bordetella bronchiseptica F-1]KDC29315.1 crossover junction endodeoxyribonuclease RusA [Bordetella bronchiseptica F2]